MPYLKRLLTLQLLCVLVLFGCVSTGEKADVKDVAPEKIKSMFKGKYEVGEYLKKHQPGTVAVLPFENETEKEEAFEVVRKTFYNHFSSLRYGDLELFKVDQRLKKEGLANPAEINSLSAQSLGKILNVDAVVYGKITHYDRVYAGVYSHVSVGASLEMVDTKKGEFLWSGEHVEKKRQGGIPTTPIGLLITAISTAVNVREIELFRVSDDLFRDMVKTIPGPTLAEASNPPEIKMLVHDAVGSPKKAGDILKVVLEGEPRYSASFDIGDFKRDIQMEEVQKGFYQGKYQVKPGDNVSGAIVTGYLTDDRGNTAEWMDVLGTVAIDTQPPDIPTGLSCMGHNLEVALKWKPNKEEDLAQYRVYRSKTPLTGYELLLSTEFTGAGDRDVENYKPFYYKVSAVDRLGNESTMSDAIKGMSIKPGPTPVSGEIVKDTTWYAGASPYIMEGNVYVRARATLNIEPGTRIESKGGSLTVQGCLKAEGDKEGMIVFGGFEKKPWDGIIFERVKDEKSRLSFCQVKNARAGLKLLSSSPQVSNTEFTKNETGLVIKGSFSKPRITGCSIFQNRKSGINAAGACSPDLAGNAVRANGEHGILCDGGNPVVQGNDIAGNEKDGIHVLSGNPKITENNIHDNGNLGIVSSPKGEPVYASLNWWGTRNGLEILSMTQGRVMVESALDGPAPEGKPFEISVLKDPLQGELTEDSYLIQAHSPYVVKKELVIDKGATLYVQPGVRLNFEPGSRGIEVFSGGINAKGKQGRPIIFSSNSPSPSPGDYLFAVKFSRKQETGSLFEFCSFKYGVNAFIIDYGKPDITYSVISDNSQAGIICGNNSFPKIEHNIIKRNSGTGAIFCKGMSSPRIHYNNFADNPFAIQSYSKIQIDARNNWWGEDPPDEGLFIGMVSYSPWLKQRMDIPFE